MGWICHTVEREESLSTTAEDLSILSLTQEWSRVTVYKNRMTSVDMSFNVQAARARSLRRNTFSLLGLNGNAGDYRTVISKNWPEFLQSTLKSSSPPNASNVVLEVARPRPPPRIVELIQPAYDEDQWVCCGSISCERTFSDLSAMLEHLVDHFLPCSMGTQRVCAWMRKNLRRRYTKTISDVPSSSSLWSTAISLLYTGLSVAWRGRCSGFGKASLEHTSTGTST